MKKFECFPIALRSLIFIFLAFNSVVFFAQENTNPNYDAALAQKHGADDYGMKTYVFVLLKSGENNSTEEPARSEAFAGHMKNINNLVELDKLIVAGPFLKNDKDYRGIFILNVATLEEASELMKTDPAIEAGYLYPEMTLWYGSAALAEYLEASDKVWKINP